MHQHPDKSPQRKSTAASTETVPTSDQQFQSNRPEHTVQRRMQALADQSPQQSRTAQLQQHADAHNRTGLPDQLKSGIEQASGFAMDDVKVHYNSSRPAQLQAHAFAQGTDIHLAPGQEKHLPHEAWHVVQQKQGRVNPTLQLQGIAVNDDAGLEQEADTMGQKALSGNLVFAGKTPETTSLRPGRTSQRKVVQRVSTQIGMDDKDEFIEHLVIRGRPPSIYQGSMGDHTTAFIVQTEGLNIALRKKTLPQAIAYLFQLIIHLNALPGVRFLQIQHPGDKADTANGKLFLHESQMLTREVHAAQQALSHSEHDRAPDHPKEKMIRNLAIQHLQLAINAYLSARELVPFSTINVGAVSKGTAGKGKGESAPAAILSAYEQREGASGIAHNTLLEAAFRLFDDSSATLLSAQNDDSIIAAMTRDILFGKLKDPEKRLELIWMQHIATIEHMFPKVYGVIKDQLTVDKLSHSLRAMREQHLISLGKEIATELEKLESQLSWYQSRYPSQKSAYWGMNLNQTQLQQIAELYRAERGVASLIEEAGPLNVQLNNRFADLIAGAERQFKEIGAKIHAGVPKYNEAKDHMAVMHLLGEALKPTEDSEDAPQKKVSAVRDFMVGSHFGEEAEKSSGRPRRSKYAKKENQKKETKTGKESLGHSENSTLTSGMSPLSIQLIMNPKNARIAGMMSKGRPHSPFMGTMGAHSTSWVVILDRIRSRIRGTNIQQATEVMTQIIKEVQLIAKQRGHLKAGEKAKILFDGTNRQMMKYANIDPLHSSISILQQMISATLSLYNLIPGVSVNKLNTNGHGEGTYRQTLLKYESYGQGSYEQISEAINGLYDGSHSGDMYDLHTHYIREAYPHSFKFWKKIAKKDVEKIPEKAREEKGSVADTGMEVTHTDLSAEEVLELQEKAADHSWLAGVNNCLINAITDGADIERATAEDVVHIRTLLNVPLGEMLAATQANLNVIVNHFGLEGRGVVVFYMHEEYIDRTTDLNHHPIFVLHDGVNHFTALGDHPPREVAEKMETVTEEKEPHDDTDHSGETIMKDSSGDNGSTMEEVD